MLNDHALLRYSRQILLPSWDLASQEALGAARVLVVGLGGLGCTLAQYLAVAGIGTLVLADFDHVELSNLARQVLHTDADIGRDKVDSAADTLRLLNPLVQVEVLKLPLDRANLPLILANVDVIADCCDNFATRDAVSALAWAAGKPLISAAAIGWQGQLAVFDPRCADSACYRCVYPLPSIEQAAEPEPTCSEAGVMASTVGVMGSWQAQEVMKVIAGVGEPLVGQLLLWDGLVNAVRRLRTPSDPACPVCSDTRS